ncbi:hypothetical protein Efla_004046 [Eimeria flavescens]
MPVGWPGDRLALGLFGPLPTARSGAKYILVGIEHYSRWVELKALQQIADEEVLAFLRDVWIPHHGVPRMVLSANGPQSYPRVLSDYIGPRSCLTSTGMLGCSAAGPPSKRWLERLWAAGVQVYQEHMKAANKRKRLLREPGTILPRGPVVAIKLTPKELQGISRKLAPRYSRPWTVPRVLENGTTYCVQDPVTHEEKEAPRERVKVLGLHGASADPAGGTNPRWIALNERRPRTFPEPAITTSRTQ